MTDDKKHYMQLNLYGMHTNAGRVCRAGESRGGWKRGELKQ